MEYEINANKYNLRCIRFTLIGQLLVLFLNEIGVFIVDKYLVRISVIFGSIVLVSTLILFRFISLDKSWVKYVIITAELLSITIMCVFLTYHVILITGIPFLMAGHYNDKRIIVYTYVFSAIGIVVGVLLGYKIGLGDLNMVALTCNNVWDYGKRTYINVKDMKMFDYGQLLLFFALPRCMILYMYANMSYAITQSVRDMQENEMKAQYKGKHDKMTGLYNRNEYTYMKENVYVNMKQIGVLYFDINGLKHMNDNYGHEKGDILINKLADSIKSIVNDKIKAYRLGGDEFITIIEDGNEENTVNLLERWEKILAVINSKNEDCICEVAVGYAYGKGKDIETIIEQADKKMYEDKKNKNKSRVI